MKHPSVYHNGRLSHPKGVGVTQGVALDRKSGGGGHDRPIDDMEKANYPNNVLM